jgi:hypothetical protein
MKILLPNSSSNYPLFLFLHNFGLVYAEMSFEIQRYIAAESDVQAKKRSQDVSKPRRMTELRLKAITVTWDGQSSAVNTILRFPLPLYFTPILHSCQSLRCACHRPDQPEDYGNRGPHLGQTFWPLTWMGIQWLAMGWMCKNGSLPVYSASMYRG